MEPKHIKCYTIVQTSRECITQQLHSWQYITLGTENLINDGKVSSKISFLKFWSKQHLYGENVSQLLVVKNNRYSAHKKWGNKSVIYGFMI